MISHAGAFVRGGADCRCSSRSLPGEASRSESCPDPHHRDSVELSPDSVTPTFVELCLSWAARCSPPLGHRARLSDPLGRSYSAEESYRNEGCANARSILEPWQAGCGTVGGLEAVTRACRHWPDMHGTDSCLVVAQVDVDNAFDSVSRQHVPDSCRALIPALSPWVDWTCGATSHVWLGAQPI